MAINGDRMYGDFLDKDNSVAIVGVSRDRKKWGYRIYRKLKPLFRKVYPVNLKYADIEGDKCYRELREIPEKPDLVITVVPPAVTERVVEICGDMNIGKLWMQPGSESEKAIKMCKERGIECMHGACFVADGLKKGFDD